MFYLPTKLLWGKEEGSPFFELCVNKKICVICSESQERLQNPIIKSVLVKLQQITQNLVISNTACSNPTSDNVIASIGNIIKGNCEIIVAIGGGSAIDCAKAAAYGAVNGTDNLWQCMDNMSLLRPKAMPILVLNTSSGTGSEINSCAVITIGTKKKALVSDAIYPVLTWVIPELSMTLPYEKTAPMYLDCIYHAVEGFLSKNSTFLSHEFSKNCIVLCLKNLVCLQQCTSRLEIRNDLALASLYSALADTYGGCISIHSLGHAISGINPSIPHGISISSVAVSYYTYLHQNGDKEYLTKENALLQILNTTNNKFDNIGSFMMFLNQMVGVKQYTLSRLGFNEHDFPMIFSNAVSSAGILFDNDPVAIREEDNYFILKQSL